MVAAGALVEALFGLSYQQGVVIVGVLMTIYVAAGGMLATTWVQIVKAVLLLIGASALTAGVMLRFNFDINVLFNTAAALHPAGDHVFRPGLLYPETIAVVSLVLSCIAGTAGLPHVLMRFFTVPDAVQARRSAMLALTLVGCLQIMVLLIGVGAMVFLVDHAQYSIGGTDLVGGSNMAAIHLSSVIGGPAFMGFVAAVTFATILAVVSGLTLSAAATVSHDLYSQVICKGVCEERRELRISRVTALALGIIAVVLSIRFEGQNVAVLATLPLSVTASTNFPILLLAMYWRGFTTRGALVGGYCGLAISLLLIVLGPNVWVQALGFERAIFPYTYPTIFSMPLAVALAWYFSVSDRTERAGQERAAFDTAILAATGRTS
jgi:cation/acetate symporter